MIYLVNIHYTYIVKRNLYKIEIYIFIVKGDHIMNKNLAIPSSIISILLMFNMTIFRENLVGTIITSILMLIISSTLVAKVLKK